MNRSNPNLVMVAGPNGAGKSTVADFLITNRSIDSYINADVIARGMAASGEQSSEISAGKVLLQVLHDALSRRQSIAFESTMSGLGWKKLIRNAKAAGYTATICYIAVSSPEISIERVAARVALGGHDIPVETIRRRYVKSLTRSLNEYRYLVDYWYFFDNSGDSAQLIAASEPSDGLAIFNAEIWSAYEQRFL